MSDVATKPVEETPVADAPVESTPAPETTATEPTTTDAPAATETAPETSEATPVPATEETVKEGESKIEATPASEGVLGFKHPPFPNTLRFSKRYFWFSDEAVKPEGLSAYLRETKAEVAHPTAAWASETGKGLLFYAKRAEDKTAPAGIINLAEVTDVTKEGHKDFSFKVNGAKYIFSTEGTEQQASWIVALEQKVEEAKGLKEGVTSSEGYKSSLEKFTKPAALVAPAAAASKSTSPGPKKSLDTKGKETLKKDDTSSASDEEKKEKKAKSRSVSRKRTSIFGTLLGKKEELQEKKEAKKEEKAEEKAEKEEAKEGESSAVPEEAGAAAVAAPVAAEEAKTEDPTPAHTAATEAPATTTDRPALDNKKKRSSVFGSFFNKVASPSNEKSEKDVVPEVPAKDEVAPVAETAPQVEAPAESKPLDTAAVTAPLDAETPAETKPTETKEAAPAKESKGLKGFFKKAEAKVEGKKEEKAAEKAEETPAAETTAPAETPAETTEAAPASTETPATETAAPKDKRRTSIFGTLSGTIKKKTAGKKTAEEKKETTEPVPAAETTDAKPEPISKEEPTEPVTNGTSTEEPKEPITDIPSEAIQTAPEVKATA